MTGDDDMPDAALFQLIDQLVAVRRGGIAEIAHVAGGRAQRAPSQGNPYFDIYRVPLARTGGALEVRLPVDGASPIRVLLLEVDTAKRCVTAAQVTDRLGQPDALNPPRPTQPAGSPVGYVYRRPWGAITVAVKPADCVSSVLLDVSA